MNNPILDEIAGLSPEAQAALAQAHKAMAGGAAAASAVPAPAPLRPPQPAVPALGASPEAPPTSALGPQAPMPSLAGAPNPLPPSLTKNAPAGTTDFDKNKLAHLKDTGSGISQIHSKIEGAMPNHPTLGKVLGWGAEIPARLADVAGSVVAPAIAARLPGTEMHHQTLLNQTGKQVSADEANAQREAATAATKAEIPVREEQAEAQKLTPLTAEEAKAAGNPLLEGIPFNAMQRAALLKQAGINTTKETIQENKPDKTPNDFEQYYHDFLTENKFPDTAHNRLLARERYAAAGAEQQKPQRELIEIPVDQNDPSKGRRLVEAKPGMVIPANAQKAGGAEKGATADEQRRADLANNMNENLNQLEDILKRRPDLFGPLAGRITEAKSAIGTSDPDIATLKGLKEWFGMASVGAHAMRNAQHVIQAADAVFNGYHNSPKAIDAAIKAARASVGTFQQDVGEKPGSTSKTGGEQIPGKKWDPVKGVYE